MANTLADRQRGRPATPLGGRADYGFSNAPKPVAPAPPAGQYPGAPPTYPGTPSYRFPTNYGGVPNYEFAPNVDSGVRAQNTQMLIQEMQRRQQEQELRAAELFQIQSQYQRPRQSRIMMLGGY